MGTERRKDSPLGGSGGFPSDMVTSDIIGGRRLKTSSETSLETGVINEIVFSFTSSRSVPAGQKLGLNISAVSATIIHEIIIPTGLEYEIYNDYCTGSADGIVSAKILNFLSVDISPATLQMWDNAVESGDRIFWSDGYPAAHIVVDQDSNPCILIKNNTVSAMTVNFTVIFEEIGERSPAFGLTPATFITPTTEMSTYG